MTKTLKEFDKLLSESHFLRVHQSHLVNLKQLEAFIKTEGGYILMKDGSRIPVSTRKRPIVLKMLDSLWDCLQKNILHLLFATKYFDIAE